jgi:hypothetical protein
MRPNVLASIALGLLAIIVASCATPRRPPVSESSVPADLTVVCGQGGGFTGLWEGHTVRSDGTVLAWSGRKAEEESHLIGSLTSEQKLALWRKIEEVKFFDLKSDERGNMTAYVRITANGRTHEVWWVPRMSEPVSESPLQQLFTLCQETASRAAATGR